MKILDLIQGSPEWNAHRATARNASDAPAMLGLSKYMTRSELLHRMATGIVPEVTQQLQARFDDGHAAEAAARPHVEAIIGDDLYPVTATTDDGYLSASFDGITLEESDFWENKLFNQELAAYIEANGDLPDTHWPQVEQQCIVRDRDNGLFTLCTREGEVKLQHRYQSRPERRQRVLDGWKQFDADLAAYVPQPATAEVVAAPVETLPAIVYQIDRGTMALTSNLPEFRAAAEAMVERMKLPLVTDQDFADRKALCKAFGEAEKLLKMKAEEAIGQISDVAAFARELGDIAELFRTARLTSEKLVDAEEKNRRAAIQQAGEKALSDHVAALQARFAGRVQMPATRGEFANAIKGKRALASIQDAVDTELAKRKIEANAVADGIDANLRALDELAPEHGFLFRDLQQLVTMPAEAFRATVEGRVATHKAQEQARIEAEVQAKLAAEKAAQQQAEAERAKQQAESAHAAAAPNETVNGEKTKVPAEKPYAKGRPSDMEILMALANHFGTDRATVIGWIEEMKADLACSA